MEKGEIARNEQFLHFPKCFLPFWITSYHFSSNLKLPSRTLSVRKRLNFVVWRRFNNPSRKKLLQILEKYRFKKKRKIETKTFSFFSNIFKSIFPSIITLDCVVKAEPFSKQRNFRLIVIDSICDHKINVTQKCNCTVKS